MGGEWSLLPGVGDQVAGPFARVRRQVLPQASLSLLVLERLHIGIIHKVAVPFRDVVGFTL